jgi:hypothetical protein
MVVNLLAHVIALLMVGWPSTGVMREQLKLLQQPLLLLIVSTVGMDIALALMSAVSK